MMVQTAQRDNVTFLLEANAPKICYKTLSNLSGDYRILHCPSINIWSVTFSHELDVNRQRWIYARIERTKLINYYSLKCNCIRSKTWQMRKI